MRAQRSRAEGKGAEKGSGESGESRKRKAGRGTKEVSHLNGNE